MACSADYTAIKPAPSPPPTLEKKRDSLKIAILTSGGDSQGMNAAIRAVVRMALASGCTPYAIHEGYEGLVQGEPMIVEFNWNSVAQIMPLGGTIIGSARSKTFRTPEGRKRAAKNLVMLDIHSLVVIGGDGSLTGADILCQEWPQWMKELEDSGEVPPGTTSRHPFINIAGMVGSIDKDMIGTEMTIGADSALHRIIEAIDAITSTACSHQRAFIIEVMGRHCGWLALAAALASGADWLFIPECPQDAASWPETLCTTLTRNRALGKRESIILLSEGAIDSTGKAITASQVQKTLTDRIGLDVRATVLGHVQRGGTPSAYDRILATLQGVHSVNFLLRAEQGQRGATTIIGMQGGSTCTLPLAECVALTRSIDDAVSRNSLDEAFNLRDRDFHEHFSIYQALCSSAQGVSMLDPASPRLAIVHVGPPSGGLNSATFAVVRSAITKGFQPMALLGGWNAVDGIDPVTLTLGWMDVDGWVGEGGSHLGTSRALPAGRLEAIAALFERERVQGLVIIGGYEAYLSLKQLQSASSSFPILGRIGIVVIPATISNNVPGTDVTLGSDTALNMIVSSCDAIRQSASSQKRAFVVEVHGGNCGYLSLMGGLASAATWSYLPEEGISLEDVMRESIHLRRRFQDDRRMGRLVMIPEQFSPAINGDTLSKLLELESEGEYDVRISKLGHLQQGREPSPFDRLLAIRFASLAVSHITEFARTQSAASVDLSRDCETTRCSLIGLHHGSVGFQSISALGAVANDKYRRTKNPAWMKVRPIAQLLAKYRVDPELLATSLEIPAGILPERK